jgi:AcrR family transcriptional regulator
MRKKPASASKETEAAGEAILPPRKRMSVADREKQILASAIQFFSEHGLNGQMRVLAQQMGITHTLFYHYFPTKQALIDRVYSELFEGRWKPDWQALLDDPALAPEEKLVRFYCDYAKTILTRDFVRIFIFSGLSDHYIPDRFFALLRSKLLPRLVRETRKYRGITSRARPSVRETELLMGLHGGIFYMGVRRWIYGQEIPADPKDPDGVALITDRVRSYLLSAPAVLDGGGAAKPRRTKLKES